MTAQPKVLPLDHAARLPQHAPAAKSPKVNVTVSPCCQPCCRHFMLYVADVHAMPAATIVSVCNVPASGSTSDFALATQPWPLPQVQKQSADWPLCQSTPLLNLLQPHTCPNSCRSGRGLPKPATSRQLRLQPSTFMTIKQPHRCKWLSVDGRPWSPASQHTPWGQKDVLHEVW